MPKTMTEKQQAVDEGWRLYNAAMEACEELTNHLQELEDEHGVDTDRPREAAYEAYSALEGPYSSGARILPNHSNEGGKA